MWAAAFSNLVRWSNTKKATHEPLPKENLDRMIFHTRYFRFLKIHQSEGYKYFYDDLSYIVSLIGSTP